MKEDLMTSLKDYIDKYWIQRSKTKDSDIKFSYVDLEGAERRKKLREEREKNQKLHPTFNFFDKLKNKVDKMIKKRELTFVELLFKFIEKKGLIDVDVYKKANIDRRLFSKIRGNIEYKPSKNTAVSLIFALELDINDASNLLRRAGLSFWDGQKEDVIFQFFIENGIYDIDLVNEALDYYDLPILGERPKNNVIIR